MKSAERLCSDPPKLFPLLIFQSSDGRLNVRALLETKSVAMAPGSHSKCSQRCLRLTSFDPHDAQAITSFSPYGPWGVTSSTTRVGGNSSAAVRNQALPSPPTVFG